MCPIFAAECLHKRELWAKFSLEQFSLPVGNDYVEKENKQEKKRVLWYLSLIYTFSTELYHPDMYVYGRLRWRGRAPGVAVERMTPSEHTGSRTKYPIVCISHVLFGCRSPVMDSIGRKTNGVGMEGPGYGRRRF